MLGARSCNLLPEQASFTLIRLRIIQALKPRIGMDRTKDMGFERGGGARRSLGWGRQDVGCDAGLLVGQDASRGCWSGNGLIR